MRRYGEEGRRLARLSRGIDPRDVNPDRETKSVSAETTFDRDMADFRALERILWEQAEEVSARLKDKELAGATVTLKLKTADFQPPHPRPFVARADPARGKNFRRRRGLLERETDGTKFRLLGVGVSALTTADQADPADFVDAPRGRGRTRVDRVRARFGEDAVVRGLAFERPEKR